jgi:hypothetical protein
VIPTWRQIDFFVVALVATASFFVGMYCMIRVLE